MILQLCLLLSIRRTIIALSHLVLTCDQAMYVKLMDSLLHELHLAIESQETSTPADHQNTRTMIQAVGAVCKQAGHRFGDQVERTVPLILPFAKKDDDDEMREHCLQACTILKLIKNVSFFCMINI